MRLSEHGRRTTWFVAASGLGALICAFLFWWGVAFLIKPGAVPLLGVVVFASAVAVGGALLTAIVVLAVRRIPTIWTFLIPLITLAIFIAVANFSTGFEWLKLFPMLVIFGPPFTSWGLLWLFLTYLVVRYVDNERRREASN